MNNKMKFTHIILIVIGLMCYNLSFAQINSGTICNTDPKCWNNEYEKLYNRFKTIEIEHDKLKNENIQLRKEKKTNNQAVPQKEPISIGNNCNKRLNELRDSFNKVIKQKELLVENSSNSKKCDKEINSLKSAKAKLEGDNRKLKAENQEIQKSVEEVKKRYSQETKVTKEYYKTPAYKNERINFTGHNFETFVVEEPSAAEIKVYIRNKKNRLASLSDLNKHIEEKGNEVLFSTNGGMYNSKREAQGYLVLNGREEKKIDVEDPKDGTNFYLKPNGVFFIDQQGKAGVLETDQYKKQKIDPKYATQSGPMLVVNGKIHPILNPFGKSKKIRSGVGVDKNGKVFFAISNEPVNFHTFAYLFKKEFHCENALFLDGTVSKAYSKHGKQELGGDFGPMIAVLHKKASKQVQPEDIKQRDEPLQNTKEDKTDPFKEKK